MTDINKNSIHATAKCIAAVTNKVQTASNPYIKKFTGNMTSSKDPLVQQLSLLALSELGKKIDLSGDKTVLNTVLELFNSNDEDTKINASIALGGITLGNVSVYLPTVIDLLNNKKDFQYLLLNTLKEVITQGDKTVYEIIKKQNLINFLFDYSETSNENLRQIVAECIGSLARHDLSLCKDLLLKNATSDNVHKKNTVAYSYRYFCTKDTQIEAINDLIDPLLKMTAEPDYNVKKSAIGSINTMVYNIPKSIQHVGSQFTDSLNDLCKFKPELVKEIELGPFKHKVDEGLGLRTSAFGFIDTALYHMLEKVDYGYLINLILIGITDPADDVQILSFQILNKLANLNPLPLSSHTDKLVDKFDESLTKFNKSLNSKQEGERVNDCVRSFVRVILTLTKIQDVEAVPKFRDFYQEKVLKNEKLKEIFDQLSQAI
mmetsp:Transcript_25555/g.22579  ORF Transcript_25555/g.22579 Transcript_25555/m.22579 type:complete len:433 (+) Transcript_25555:2434-3732(+)